VSVTGEVRQLARAQQVPQALRHTCWAVRVQAAVPLPAVVLWSLAEKVEAWPGSTPSDAPHMRYSYMHTV
jgi:hypothetical protein